MITTIIEKHLQAIDQATFQKMMNHLLFLEGYKFLGSPGSVIGKNKTSKGSPDSFFEDGESYVFCECTTQERLKKGESFIKKLKKDVDHCFDEKKTKVLKTEVSTVLLAFTSKLPADEHNALKKQIKGHNPNAELVYYSIQEIPFRLVYYPGLADKYIPGVKTTNGTFHTLPDFLEITNNGLQPSLTNQFVEREDELKEAKTILLNTDVLILTGGQGVGKSKIAVELLENLEEELGYEPRVISGSPVSIWDDLPNFLLPKKDYVVFFDDANKALPNLEYLIHYLKSRQTGVLKIVVTVRDYVKHELEKYLEDIQHQFLPIEPLKDEQIRKVVNALLPEGKAFDSIPLEHIVSLAKGNSRLALMAASSILDKNDISILKNVFSLYDQYFKKAQNEISFLDNPNSLKALGILSFFGVLDRNNKEVCQILEEHFEIEWDALWETFVELERSELTDVFFHRSSQSFRSSARHVCFLQDVH